MTFEATRSSFLGRFVFVSCATRCFHEVTDVEARMDSEEHPALVYRSIRVSVLRKVLSSRLVSVFMSAPPGSSGLHCRSKVQ